MKFARLLLLVCIIKLSSHNTFSQNTVRHFVFFSKEREAIHDSVFYNHPGIHGAQITYSWRSLEPSKDLYDFSIIENDLVFLQSKGKKLFIQLQDLTFDSRYYGVPDYIIADSGIVRSTYSGWIPKRWDSAVSCRFHSLLNALGEQFDGRIEGINLQETSIDIHEGFAGFSRQKYLQALKRNMRVMRMAFQKSLPVMYANFMPGDSKTDLAELYAYAREIKCGMGGPDIKVHRPAQMKNSYPLLHDISRFVPVAMAVQEGNYSVENPKTGKPATIAEILDFGINYLGASYIFWCREEPFYTREVLGLLMKYD